MYHKHYSLIIRIIWLFLNQKLVLSQNFRYFLSPQTSAWTFPSVAESSGVSENTGYGVRLMKSAKGSAVSSVYLFGRKNLNFSVMARTALFWARNLFLSHMKHNCKDEYAFSALFLSGNVNIAHILLSRPLYIGQTEAVR